MKALILKWWRAAHTGAALAIFTLMLTACGGGSSGLVVWTGAGASVETRQTGTASQVALLGLDGRLTPIFEVSANAIGVKACGTESASPDGTRFMFYISEPSGGGDNGRLMQVSGGQAVQIDTVEGLACAGNGTFRYSPDGQRMAYIAYDSINNREYARGQLRLRSSADARSVVTFDNVTAFVLGNNSVSFVSLFTNARDQVDEAAISQWNGTETTELATLYADANCRFTSAQLASAGENRLVVVMGQRCGSSGTQWQFYTLNISEQTATRALTGAQAGGFFPYARTNNIFTYQGGGSVAFTSADGFADNSVSVFGVDLADISEEQTLIERGAIMARHDALRFSLPNNAAPDYSPDGRWVAIVVSDGRSSTQLALLDLSAPDNDLTFIPTPDRGDTISFLEFSADSKQLYYLARGASGNDNALFRVDLETLQESRMWRGRFGSGAVTPDGVALVEYNTTDATPAREYVDLVLVSGSENEPRTLFSGLNGDTRTFIYPLGWVK